MNTYTVEAPTLDTLSDFYALHPDPADVTRRLPILRENVAAGRVRLENILILRSERGVEGTVLIPGPVQVPVFPRYRADTPTDAVTAFARALRERVQPERALVLQDDQAPLNAAPVEAAGWVLDDCHVMYQTDLHARMYQLDPQAQEGGAEWLSRPDIRQLLQHLNQADWEWAEGWTLVALPDATGRLVALGAVGPNPRPGYANLNMIGVLPEARGRGLGTRLHAHLLALAAGKYQHHGGGTGQGNHAMRRIFEKNGCQVVATQMYFKQG